MGWDFGLKLRESFELLLALSMKKFAFSLCFSLLFSSLWAQQKSWDLVDVQITQLTENTFVHSSFLQTNDFGKVSCNGLIVRDGAEVVIFDTPTDDAGSKILLQWIQQTLHARVKAIVPTHFHNDCLGGLHAFHDAGIPSVANQMTIELARLNQVIVPNQGFQKQIELPVGNSTVHVHDFGAGHTKDNVVAYFAKEKVLFGGCLLKELHASKGFLGDAVVADWSRTVMHVKQAFPDVKWVVPGHGQVGDKALLDYTIQLFLPQK
jgi:metallo-beta-lactamase class B